MQVRRGEIPLRRVLERLHEQSALLEGTILISDLADEPDRDAVDRFLVVRTRTGAHGPPSSELLPTEAPPQARRQAPSRVGRRLSFQSAWLSQEMTLQRWQVGGESSFGLGVTHRLEGLVTIGLFRGCPHLVVE